MSRGMSITATEPDVIVGVPICRRTSFVLDRFLANQREIQMACPGRRLALAVLSSLDRLSVGSRSGATNFIMGRSFLKIRCSIWTWPDVAPGWAKASLCQQGTTETVNATRVSSPSQWGGFEQ